MLKTCAAIDLGSNAIRLTIFECLPDGGYKILESLSQPLRLGKETFVNLEIGPEHFKKAVKIIEGFSRVMDEYAVSTVISVTTSAVREAKNRLDFIDYIQSKTGVRLEILEDTEETRLTFLALERELGGDKGYFSGNNLIIELGSGNVKTIFIRDGVILVSQLHKIGALRVMEILKDVNIQQHKFEKVLREFIRTDVHLLREELPDEKLDRFIVVGALVPEIISYISSGKLKNKRRLKTLELMKILDEYGKLTLHQFTERFSLSQDRADILLPSLHIFTGFLDSFSPREVVLSEITLTDGLILNLGRKSYDFSPHILASAEYLGKKYFNDEEHAAGVHSISVEIFNKTKSLHRLKKGDLLILEVAAILHDVGRFVNSREHHKHSEYLIANASIAGLTRKQLQMAAVIARNHRRFTIKYGENLKAGFSSRERMKIRKLSAILRLANTLDLGHSGTGSGVNIRYQKKKERLRFEIPGRGDFQLEEWGFNRSKRLFEAVFNTECQWFVNEEL